MYNKKLEKSVSVGMKVIMLFYNKQKKTYHVMSSFKKKNIKLHVLYGSNYFSEKFYLQKAENVLNIKNGCKNVILLWDLIGYFPSLFSKISSIDATVLFELCIFFN